MLSLYANRNLRVDRTGSITTYTLIPLRHASLGTSIYIPTAQGGRTSFTVTGTSGVDSVFTAIFSVVEGSTAPILLTRLLPPEVEESKLVAQSFEESLVATGKLLYRGLPASPSNHRAAVARRLAVMTIDHAKGFFDAPRAHLIDRLPGVTHAAAASKDGLHLGPEQFNPEVAFAAFAQDDMELLGLNDPPQRIRYRPLLLARSTSSPGFNDGGTPANELERVFRATRLASAIPNGTLDDRVPVMMRLRVLDDERLPITGPEGSLLPRCESQSSLDAFRFMAEPKAARARNEDGPRHPMVQPYLNEAKNRLFAPKERINYFAIVAEQDSWHLCASWLLKDRNRCATALKRGRPRYSEAINLGPLRTFPSLNQITKAAGCSRIRVHSLLYAMM
ncbi:hypothetical protein H9P43_002520 [Blastocladiella emersonii ATCC 22665]|nr:hypothetical protein H9P43_002520 [Blastocladiella emersonii ATCC 22665]